MAVALTYTMTPTTVVRAVTTVLIRKYVRRGCAVKVMDIRKGQPRGLALALIIIMALSTVAASNGPMNSPNYGVSWNVVGQGGGTMSSTHFGVQGTIGTVADNTGHSSNFSVSSGYWSRQLTLVYRVFVPMVSRQ